MALAEQPAYAGFPAFCLIHLGLANVLREKKAWDEAEIHLHQGLETAQKSGHRLYLAQGYLIAARLHHAQGKITQAQDDLRHADEIAGVIHNRFLNDAVSQTRREIEIKSSSSQPLIEPLSERELDVLRLICAGRSNQEIADELFIALDTVKRHANNLYGKLGVRRRAQAIFFSRIPPWWVQLSNPLPYIQDMKTQGTAMNYEIRVQGYLGKNAAIWFDGFDVEHTPEGETILRGTVIDQAALHGILTRIRDLGLTLTLVQEMGKEQ